MLIDLLLLLAVTVVAAIVRGYAGFGFSAIAITAASLSFEPAEIVPLLYLLEIVASLFMWRSVRTQLDWRLLGFVLLGCLVTLPLGQYLLVHLAPDAARLFIFSGVLLCCLLVWTGWELKSQMSRPLALLAGTFIGLGSGMGSIGGLPAMVVFLATRYEPAKTRALFVATFFVLYVFGSFITHLNGLLTSETLARAGWLVVPMLIGITVGQRYFKASSAGSYRKAALALMVLLSIAGLIKLFASH